MTTRWVLWILLAGGGALAESPVAAPVVGLVPAAEPEITAAMAAGARLALEQIGSRTGAPLALEVANVPGGWSSAAGTAVELGLDGQALALITPPDRATAHLMAQLGTRAHLPIVSTSEAASVTSSGSYWLVSVAPASAPGAEFVRAYEAAEGRPPDRWAVLGYDAAAAIAQAALDAGPDRRAVVEAWRAEIPIPGAAGSFGFDRFGRRRGPG